MAGAAEEQESNPNQPPDMADQAALSRFPRLEDWYVIGREIGRGGQGIVYEAVHKSTQAIRAVKKIYREQMMDDEFRARFFQEAAIVMNLRHDNIITVHDICMDDEGLLCMVMERLKGEALAEILKREKALDPARAVNLIAQAADALAYAHEQSFVHRDIKPNNIFVLAGDRVKLIDFGLARALVMQAGKRRVGRLVFDRPDRIIGSFPYMSPEHVNPEKVEPRSDIYSLGVVLYQTITGALPFQSRNPFQLLSMHVNSLPIRPRQYAPELSELLELRILWALEKHPANRPPTIREWASSLRQALAESPKEAEDEEEFAPTEKYSEDLDPPEVSRPSVPPSPAAKFPSTPVPTVSKKVRKGKISFSPGLPGMAPPAPPPVSIHRPANAPSPASMRGLANAPSPASMRGLANAPPPGPLQPPGFAPLSGPLSPARSGSKTPRPILDDLAFSTPRTTTSRPCMEGLSPDETVEMAPPKQASPIGDATWAAQYNQHLKIRRAENVRKFSTLILVAGAVLILFLGSMVWHDKDMSQTPGQPGPPPETPAVSPTPASAPTLTPAPKGAEASHPSRANPSPEPGNSPDPEISPEFPPNFRNETPDNSLLISSFFKVATQHLQDGAYEKAYQEFATVLEKEPLNAEAIMGAARALGGWGKIEEAVKLCEEALQKKNLIMRDGDRDTMRRWVKYPDLLRPSSRAAQTAEGNGATPGAIQQTPAAPPGTQPPVSPAPGNAPSPQDKQTGESNSSS